MTDFKVETPKKKTTFNQTVAKPTDFELDVCKQLSSPIRREKNMNITEMSSTHSQDVKHLFSKTQRSS